MNTKQPQGNWWKSFYEDTPFELYMARNDKAELEATIRFLVRHLRLRQGSLIFDQCSGFGGMSIPLSERGYRIIGTDLCEKYIAMATARAAESGLPARYFVGDAFQFVAQEPCDAAFNWYTSFGYSESDEVNMSMLRRAFESLKPGGRFALDYPNMPFVFANFKNSMVTRLASPAGEILLFRECAIDVVRGTMDQKWTYAMPDGRRIEQKSTLKIYMPWEIASMLQRAGFENVQLFGGLKSEPLTISAGRLIAVARRPKC